MSTTALGGESLWIATTPSTSFPRLDADVDTDVAVVGAGITGITCALLLKRAGKRVALLEMSRVAGGASGYTTAKLTSGHKLIYTALEEKFGPEGARLYAVANESAIALIESLVNNYGIDCDLERKPNYVYAEGSEGGVTQIEEEAAAAQRAGLRASIVTETSLPFPVAAAVYLPDQAQFHPRKYLLALADRISGDGSYVFEETRALDVIQGSPCVVETDRGRVRADDVVLATHLPFEDKGFFFAKAYPSRSYAIAGPLDDGAPEGMFINVEDPVRSVRTASSDQGRCLIVGGEGHKPGEEADTRLCYTRLEEWARERFGIEKIAFRWSTQDFVSVDQLPFVGPLVPKGDHVWVATAYGKWGMTNGTAAASLLTNRILGLERAEPDIFDSTRLGSVLTKGLVSENAKAVRHLLGDRLSLPGPEALDRLSPGEGVVARIHGANRAVSKTDAGDLLAVSAACTHLGCLVAWNTAERTWDCPCHGSRYLPDGTVIEGPAVKDLQPLDLDQG